MSAKPPPGFEDYFGPGPLFRFVEFDGMEGFEDLIEKIRDFPEGTSAEDTMRQLFGDQGAGYNEVNLRKCLNHLFDIIDADPEIEVSACSSQHQPSKADLNLRRAFSDTQRARLPRRVLYWKSAAVLRSTAFRAGSR